MNADRTAILAPYVPVLGHTLVNEILGWPVLTLQLAFSFGLACRTPQVSPEIRRPAPVRQLRSILEHGVIATWQPYHVVAHAEYMS